MKSLIEQHEGALEEIQRSYNRGVRHGLVTAAIVIFGTIFTVGWLLHQIYTVD